MEDRVVVRLGVEIAGVGVAAASARSEGARERPARRAPRSRSNRTTSAGGSDPPRRISAMCPDPWPNPRLYRVLTQMSFESGTALENGRARSFRKGPERAGGRPRRPEHANTAGPRGSLRDRGTGRRRQAARRARPCGERDGSDRSRLGRQARAVDRGKAGGWWLPSPAAIRHVEQQLFDPVPDAGRHLVARQEASDQSAGPILAFVRRIPKQAGARFRQELAEQHAPAPGTPRYLVISFEGKDGDRSPSGGSSHPAPRRGAAVRGRARSAAALGSRSDRRRTVPGVRPRAGRVRAQWPNSGARRRGEFAPPVRGAATAPSRGSDPPYGARYPPVTGSVGRCPSSSIRRWRQLSHRRTVCPHSGDSVVPAGLAVAVRSPSGIPQPSQYTLLPRIAMFRARAREDKPFTAGARGRA